MSPVQIWILTPLLVTGTFIITLEKHFVDAFSKFHPIGNKSDIYKKPNRSGKFRI